MFSRSGFVSWVRENAVPFEPLDGSLADVEALSVFDDALADRRIVFLGEQNHWIHEKYDYRLWFLRYLFSRGFRTLGEELSWADGVQIDRYLAGGDPSELDRIATYGYRGAWRTDRDDAPTGYLRESWDSYPTDLFRAEQVRFARALRALSEGRSEGERLRFFGFDVDGLPGLAYEQLEWMIPEGGDDPKLAALRTRLARVPNESLSDEMARLDDAIARLQGPGGGTRDALQTVGADPDDVHRSVRTLRESLAYMRVAHAAPTIEALQPALLHREALMHEHVAHVIDRLAVGEKIVLMAANDHLCKEVRGIRRHTAGASPGGEGVPPVGTFVARRHPGEVFAAWFLYESGEDSQPFVSLGNRLRSPRSSLNRQLGYAGDAFALPVRADSARAAPLRDEAKVVSLYNTTYRARPVEQADAICFVREVGPLRPS